MTTTQIMIRRAAVLIALPIVLVVLASGFFYSVFYFPNRTSATAGTVVSSSQKRDYLLYIPKSYDPAKPAPLVITLHTPSAHRVGVRQHARRGQPSLRLDKHTSYLRFLAEW